MRYGQGAELLSYCEEIAKDALIVLFLVHLSDFLLEVCKLGCFGSICRKCHAGIDVLAQEIDYISDLLGLCL
jgi:hypothetical protein